ncbi:MAG TPA: NADP-dependent methylenetetrahydromethanopterin/methylenetetrahydrofolate dehydrogenase [Methylibium sp.]|nr:NADP-dependent methylenetetrahydromethanopterin/methylenetetrahydrofolate dehydrogenase [Methylibium sp.]
MKKLLYQFDTDEHPSVFDNVVCHDGGADHVIGYGGVHPHNVGAMVDGAIFTRAPKDKKNTAIFIGGSNMAEGEALFKAVKKKFFANFRVSVMLDSNGSNTTAAACVAWLANGRSLQGKKAVILAGTGPVGTRAAVMLASEGVSVTLTSRKLATAEEAAAQLKARFGLDVGVVEAVDNAARARAIAGANIVISTGAGGIQLLDEAAWRDNPTLELISDANATPPLGIEGIDMMDKGVSKHGKIVFGAIGFGALKIALQRACVARLFESNDLSLDAAEIYAMAKTMIG